MRGHQKDYEAWANMTGDPSWNYEGVIPHFKAIEDFHDDWEDRKCKTVVILQHKFI
jgi:choline dehydrogenase-like flavoprotein